ncbi:MAG: hypothetical protein WA799_05100 [Nitrosotalea sp.]
MTDNKDNKEIIGRLDAIIGLLTENLVGSGLIGKGRAIEVLYTAGLSPTEIGKIFHLPATSIGSIVSRQSKQKRTHKKAR